MLLLHYMHMSIYVYYMLYFLFVIRALSRNRFGLGYELYKSTTNLQDEKK